MTVSLEARPGGGLLKERRLPFSSLFLRVGSPCSAVSMAGHSVSPSVSVLYIATWVQGEKRRLTKFSISVTLCQKGSLTDLLPRGEKYLFVFRCYSGTLNRWEDKHS